MPNGGPDNCGTCGFNRRNRGEWRNPQPDESIIPFCEIRATPVINDHWTYCRNWHTRSRQPDGPIYASGLYENSYRRIPWHGLIAPEQIENGVCIICRRSFHEGLEVARTERAPAQFCCNLHYLQWWKGEHPGEDAPMSAGIFEH